MTRFMHAVLPFALLLGLTTAGAAQTGLAPDHAGDPATATFTGPWSPFALPGDLPRLAPAAPLRVPGEAPVPRIGLFWTAGNPGALPLEVTDTRGDFQLGHTAASGDYRRPLDPGRSRLDRLNMSAWGPIEERSAMIGRVRFERVELDPAPWPHAVEPYGSAPFAVLDTTTTAIRHTGAALEGAAGWELGGFGLGLSVGHAASDGRTEATGVPRRSHATAPAATFGLARPFADGRLAAGLTLRWTQRTETLRINAVGAGTDIYVVDGFLEPERVRLDRGAFYRRTERDGLGAGAALSGRIGAWRWAAHGEAARHEERLWSRQENDPPRDTWDADALRATLAVQSTIRGRILTLQGRWAALSGAATRANPRAEEDGATAVESLRADETTLHATAELRQRVGSDGWGGALRLSAGYIHSDRVDPRSDVSLLVETLVMGAAVELDSRVTERLLLSAGAAIDQHQGRGAIPHAQSLGPVISDLLYGEVGLQAATALPWAFSGSATFQLRDHVRLWLGGHYTATAPGETVFAPLPPMDGTSRTGWGLTLGATLGAPDGP